MRSEAHERTIASIYDAALMPDLWPAALQSVIEAARLALAIASIADEMGASNCSACRGLSSKQGNVTPITITRATRNGRWSKPPRELNGAWPIA